MSRGNGGEKIYRRDEDRRRFLGLLSELPERFGTEIHAFMLMDNHYHLLVRCRRGALGETLRWLQTTYAVRFNWRHRRHGHLFQGRFKSVLVQDETALDEVARYIHLNPVRIGGLGLSKEDQRRAGVLGCADPGAELVARRLGRLREYPWSSWQVYSGQESAPGWLSLERIGGPSEGRRRKARRAALIESTEQPIRQGRLESRWQGVVGGVVLGDAAEAVELIRKAAQNPERAGQAVAALARRTRPPWREIVRATESILGRRWKDICQHHGDWGRDGVVAVATRHLGWRLVEVATEVDGVKYAALAQGVRRFWRLSPNRPELANFVQTLRQKCQ